jgi:serine/threonine protein kinase
MTTMEPGTGFGAYTIEGFIAGGGMGEVYAARHGVYGSPVALKVLHPSLHADDSWRARFNEEGLVGQQLKHPHVLAARELIEAEGRVALVLDLVRGGQTLLKVVNREFATGIPLVQSLQVFLGILQGVEYLHGKGIVHGDIKPENVLLQGDFRDPATWIPLVTDFGTVGLIAHPVFIDGVTAVVASPRYASPEHMQGVDRLDVRSDIYSLGLVLHYLLTGRHASDARDVAEAAIRVLQPVSLVHMVDQPESVLALVRTACAVDPAQRFAACRDMALAIRRTLDELGVKLQLEDLQADLATEVMEERLRMRREAADNAAPVIDEQATEATETGEAPMRRDREDATPPGSPPGPPPAPPNADDEEPAPDGGLAANPLWRRATASEEEDLSDAPTARLGPAPPGGEDATIRLPTEAEAPASMASTDPVARREMTGPKPTPVAPRPPEPPSAGPAGIPVIAWLAVAAAAALVALVVVYLVVG